MTAHAAFHAALVAAGRQQLAPTHPRASLRQSERYRRLSVPAEPLRRDVEGEHRAIMEAALAREVDPATAELSGHLRLTTRILLTADFLLEVDGSG